MSDTTSQQQAGELACARKGCDGQATTRGFCESDYRRRVRMGIYKYRDAGPAREHVLKLRALGWTYVQIAATAQVSTWVPHKLATGVTRNLWGESEEAILALPLEPRGSHRGVDGTGTYRRCEALLWMGWPWAEMDRRAGLKPYTLATLRTRKEPVSFRVAQAIAATYAELSHLPGPSKMTATKARRSGYAPPAAWDEDTIDDPKSRPAGVRKAA